MSPENVEIMHWLWGEFQTSMERGDPGASFDSDAVSEDLEWTLSIPLDGRSVWRGREDYVDFIRTWTGEFEHWSIRAEQMIDAGDDKVVVLTHQTAVGKESGVPVDLKLGQVNELEDGRLVRVRNYLSHEEALDAAGLRE